jgi:hypothetical protein
MTLPTNALSIFQDQYPGATLRTHAIFEFDREMVCTSGDILFLFQRELLRLHKFQQTWVTIGPEQGKELHSIIDTEPPLLVG